MHSSKSIFLISVLLLPVLAINITSQANQEWVQRYNGPGNNQDISYIVKADNSGNVYVSGQSIGNGTGLDFCTIKYNSGGSQIWAQRYNGPGNGEDVSVSLDIDINNNVYVSGYSLGKKANFDFCTIKYNSEGVQQWVARYDGPGNDDDKVCAMKTDNSGNIYVTGSSVSSINGPEQYLTIKYNTNGALQWHCIYDYDPGYPDIPADLAVDLNNNVYITGTSTSGYDLWEDYCTIKYSSSGSQLWVARFSLPSVVSTDEAYALYVDNAGNIYVTGYAENYRGKMCTIKYNDLGAQLWVALYDENTVSQGNDIAVYNNENVYVTGYSSGQFITLKYNSNGVLQWYRKYYKGVISIANSIAIDVWENIYTTGYSLELLNTDYVTIKYNSSGDSLWVKTYNGTSDSNDVANSLCLDNTGNVYVTGWSRGINSNKDITTIKYSQLIGVKPISSEIPNEYSLSQNYPNPLNPSTKIKFDIPSVGNGRDRSAVQIAVYDISGKLVETLVNENLSPGTYEVTWSAAKYSSGVYFYKLVSGNFIQTKKMILVK